MSSSFAFLASRILTQTGSRIDGLFKSVAARIYRPKLTIKDKAWGDFCRAGGEELRYNYELTDQSFIVDLGGYDGQFASDLYGRFGCFIYVFEVYQPYAEAIKKRFVLNPRVKVFDFGLGARDERIRIAVDSVSSSAFKSSSVMADAEIREAATFLKSSAPDHIALMKINIEGGEYDLLDHLIDSKLIEKIENIQVQFHDFVPDALIRMQHIRQRLSATHTATYHFDFIWENWKRTERK